MGSSIRYLQQITWELFWLGAIEFFVSKPLYRLIRIAKEALLASIHPLLNVGWIGSFIAIILETT